MPDNLLYSGKGDYFDMLDMIIKAKTFIKSSEKEIVFDISDMSFIRPYHLVIFACIIEEFSRHFNNN